jgi:hypothetical protein
MTKKLEIDENWAREGAQLAAKRAAERAAEKRVNNGAQPLPDSHWWQAIGCAIIGWADIIVATVKYPTTAPERFVLLALGLVAIGGMLVLATKEEVRK